MSRVHMGPDEAVRAHQILGAETSIAIHHGTFQLADDGIDTPKKQLIAARGTRSFVVAQQRPIRGHSMIDRQAHARVDQHSGQFAGRAGRVIPRLRSAGRRTRAAADLTRAVTYGAFFGIGYGLFLGPVFGLMSGIAHGITLAWEYSRASRGQPKSGFWVDTAHECDPRVRFCLGSFLFIWSSVRHHVWRVEHGRAGDRVSALVSGRPSTTSPPRVRV